MSVFVSDWIVDFDDDGLVGIGFCEIGKFLYFGEESVVGVDVVFDG